MTRASSSSTSPGSSTCSSSSKQTTTSKERSGNGSRRTSPARRLTFSTTASWARRIVSSSISTHTTSSAPARARIVLPYAVPQPASSTRFPLTNADTHQYRPTCSASISRPCMSAGSKRSGGVSSRTSSWLLVNVSSRSASSDIGGLQVQLGEECVPLQQRRPRIRRVDVGEVDHRHPPNSIAGHDLGNLNAVHARLRKRAPEREILPAVEALVSRVAADLLERLSTDQGSRVDVVPASEPLLAPGQPVHQAGASAAVEALEQAVRKCRVGILVQGCDKTTESVRIDGVVRVEDEEQLSACLLRAVIAGGGKAFVEWQPDEPGWKPVEVRQRLGCGFVGAVGRGVVHHDDLEILEAAERDARKRLGDELLVVVEAHDDRDAWSACSARAEPAHLGLEPLVRPFELREPLLEPSLVEDEPLQGHVGEPRLGRMAQGRPRRHRGRQSPRKRHACGPRSSRRRGFGDFVRGLEQRRGVEPKLVSQVAVRVLLNLPKPLLVFEQLFHHERQAAAAGADEVFARHEWLRAERALGDDDTAVCDRLNDSLPLEVGRFVTVDVDQDLARSQVLPLPSAYEEIRAAGRVRLKAFAEVEGDPPAFEDLCAASQRLASPLGIAPEEGDVHGPWSVVLSTPAVPVADVPKGETLSSDASPLQLGDA